MLIHQTWKEFSLHDKLRKSENNSPASELAHVEHVAKQLVDVLLVPRGSDVLEDIDTPTDSEDAKTPRKYRIILVNATN